MKKFKGWGLKILAFVILIFTILVVIILNPKISYAKKLSYKTIEIFSSNEIPNKFLQQIDSSLLLIKKSELYDSNFKIQLCLNDGSIYPSITENLLGKAFARGYLNKVVIYGKINFIENKVQLNGYNWNLTELVAHEIVHCYQYNELGLFKSNPLAKYPQWKWEGYAEYVARSNYNDLINNIKKYKESNENHWGITLNDNTICPREYYLHWLMVQYCIDVKKIDFLSLLKTRFNEKGLEKEMFAYFKAP
jgi:hypothetical protein